MSTGCRFTPFYSDDTCDLALCPDCGRVHLSMGVVSLTLTGAQFERLIQSLNTAQARMPLAHSKQATPLN